MDVQAEPDALAELARLGVPRVPAVADGDGGHARDAEPRQLGEGIGLWRTDRLS